MYCDRQISIIACTGERHNQKFLSIQNWESSRRRQRLMQQGDGLFIRFSTTPNLGSLQVFTNKTSLNLMLYKQTQTK